MQQTAEKRCTNPLSFSTQRRLTLQNTCSSAFAFRKHSHPDTKDERRGAERKVWAPAPCMCVHVHINSLGSFSSKHHYVHLITLINLSRVCIMYSSPCIRSQGHSLSDRVSEYVLVAVEWHFSQITHESLQGLAMCLQDNKKAGTIFVCRQTCVCICWRIVQYVLYSLLFLC